MKLASLLILSRYDDLAHGCLGHLRCPPLTSATCHATISGAQPLSLLALELQALDASCSSEAHHTLCKHTPQPPRPRVRRESRMCRRSTARLRWCKGYVRCLYNVQYPRLSFDDWPGLGPIFYHQPVVICSFRKPGTGHLTSRSYRCTVYIK